MDYISTVCGIDRVLENDDGELDLQSTGDTIWKVQRWFFISAGDSKYYIQSKSDTSLYLQDPGVTGETPTLGTSTDDDAMWTVYSPGCGDTSAVTC